MNKKEFEKVFQERQQQAQLRSLDANRNRAQAVSIGMSGSGTTEITMRGQDGTFLWNCYQPVQVIEFIHQLAASIGCHIHVQPRNDFASWREWRQIDEQEKLHLNGFPPFAEELTEDKKVGLAPPEEENSPTENDNVATKKAVNKRSTKRAGAPAR